MVPNQRGLIEVGQRNAQDFFSPVYFVHKYIHNSVTSRTLSSSMTAKDPRHMIQSEEIYVIVFGSRAFV